MDSHLVMIRRYRVSQVPVCCLRRDRPGRSHGPRIAASIVLSSDAYGADWRGTDLRLAPGQSAFKAGGPPGVPLGFAAKFLGFALGWAGLSPSRRGQGRRDA